MDRSIVIIDYGIGNLFSVLRAFEYCDAPVTISNNSDVILSASHLVLPGVGAFQDGMNGLVTRGLDLIVKKYAASGRPLLGICLGMQMLATVSEEFGKHIGLNIIPGTVSPIPNSDTNSKKYKVPFVGWAELQSENVSLKWKGTILDGLTHNEAVYLTHSFAVTPTDPAHRLAYCNYNGAEVTSSLCCRNVYGVQFHPEKSGPVGLRIINNFSRL